MKKRLEALCLSAMCILFGLGILAAQRHATHYIGTIIIVVAGIGAVAAIGLVWIDERASNRNRRTQ